MVPAVCKIKAKDRKYDTNTSCSSKKERRRWWGTASKKREFETSKGRQGYGNLIHWILLTVSGKKDPDYGIQNPKTRTWNLEPRSEYTPQNQKSWNLVTFKWNPDLRIQNLWYVQNSLETRTFELGSKSKNPEPGILIPQSRTWDPEPSKHEIKQNK